MLNWILGGLPYPTSMTEGAIIQELGQYADDISKTPDQTRVEGLIDELGKRALKLIEEQPLVDTDLYVNFDKLVKVRKFTFITKALEKPQNQPLLKILAGLKGMHKSSSENNLPLKPSKDQLLNRMTELEKGSSIPFLERRAQALENEVKKLQNEVRGYEEALAGAHELTYTTQQELYQLKAEKDRQIANLQIEIADLKRGAPTDENLQLELQIARSEITELKSPSRSTPQRSSNRNVETLNMDDIKKSTIQANVKQLEQRLQKNSAEGSLFLVIADQIEDEMTNIGIYQSTLENIRSDLEKKAQQTEEQLNHAIERSGGRDNEEIRALKRQLKEQTNLVNTLQNVLNPGKANAPAFTQAPTHQVDADQYQELKQRFTSLEEAYDALQQKAQQGQHISEGLQNELNIARLEAHNTLIKMEDLQARQKQWESLRTQLIKEIRELTATVDAEKKKTMEANLRAEALQKAVTEEIRRRIGGEKEIAELNQELAALKEGKQAQEAEIQKVKHAIETKTAELVKLKEELEFAQGDANTLREIAKTRGNESTNLQQQYAQLQQQIQAKQAALEALSKEKAQLQDIVTGLQQQLKDKESTLEQLKTLAGQIQATLQGTIDDLTHRLTISENEKATLQTELDKLEQMRLATGNELQQEIGTLKQQLKDLSEKTDALNKELAQKVDELGSVKAKSSEEIKSLTDDLNNLNLRLNQADAEHAKRSKAFEEQIAQLDSQLSEAARESAQLQEQLKGKEAALEQLTRQLHETQANLQSNIDALKDRVSATEVEKASLEAKTKELEANLIQKGTENEYLEGQLKELQQLFDSLEQEAALLRGDLLQATNELSAVKAEGALKQQALTRELDQLRNEYRQHRVRVKLNLDLQLSFVKRELANTYSQLDALDLKTSEQEIQWAGHIGQLEMKLSESEIQRGRLEGTLSEYQKREEEIREAVQQHQQDWDDQSAELLAKTNELRILKAVLQKQVETNLRLEAETNRIEEAYQKKFAGVQANFEKLQQLQSRMGPGSKEEEALKQRLLEIHQKVGETYTTLRSAFNGINGPLELPIEELLVELVRLGDEIKDQLQKTRKENEATQRELSEYKDKWVDREEQYQQQIMALQSNERRLSQINAQLQAKLDGMVQQPKGSNGHRNGDGKEKQIRELSATQLELEFLNKELTREKEDLQKELSHLKKLAKQADALASEKNAVEKLKSQLLADNEKLQDRDLKLTQSKDAVVEENKRLRKEIEEFRVVMDEAVQDALKSDTKRQEAFAKVQATQERLTQETMLRQESDKKNAELAARVKELEARLVDVSSPMKKAATKKTGNGQNGHQV